jgi:ubiquinone/menaquinone biosynthesis C-methylase UbiE
MVKLINKFIVEKVFHPVYKKKVAKTISKLCEDNSLVLDFGCGNGNVSKLISNDKNNVRIIGTDLENRSCEISFVKCLEYNLPFNDNYFNTTIVVDVLHHIPNIEKMLSEIKRVTKNYIIIKEHAANNFFENALVCIGDHLTNYIFEIKCINNYPSIKQWENIFKRMNLEIIEQPKKLNYGFGLTEKLNPIFKLKIRK